MARGPLLDPLRVRVALVAHQGNRTRAARELRCRRIALVHYLARHPSIAADLAPVYGRPAVDTIAIDSDDEL